jgi:spore coat assembly protein
VFKVGDIVARKSYGNDILFKVVEIKKSGKENMVTLKGINYRIEADAPESDLALQSDRYISENNERFCRAIEKKCQEAIASRETGKLKKLFTRDTAKDGSRDFSRPGKVLHIDGDNDYLDACLEKYKSFGIEAVGKYIAEKEQPGSIYKLLQENRPDILVLTGHDGLIKGDNNINDINSYRNSKYYISAVKEARRYESDLDSLTIFAGACQSMYNEIIKAGANFASAPYRVLIHALDPVFICQKIAFASIDKILTPLDVISGTITGYKGIGGIQTRGKYRNGYPSEPSSLQP